MKNFRDRLKRMEVWLARTPIAPEALRAAYEHFRKTGELPEDDELGEHVVRWANTKVDPTQFGDDQASFARLAGLYVDHMMKREYGDRVPGYEPFDGQMEALRDEAVAPWEPARSLARHVLQSFAMIGRDPTGSVISDLGLTISGGSGSVAMDFMGFPDRFVLGKHRRRARAIVDRMEKLGKATAGEQGFVDACLDASDALHVAGELPHDLRLLDVAVADIELRALMQARAGLDVSPLLAACAASRRGRPEKRRRAATEIMEMLKAGALIVPETALQALESDRLKPESQPEG
jgi:hypothetical protein